MAKVVPFGKRPFQEAPDPIPFARAIFAKGRDAALRRIARRDDVPQVNEDLDGGPAP